MPATPVLGAGGSGNADVAVDVVQGDTSPAELQFLGDGGPSRGRPPGAGGWCGCSRKFVPCPEYTFIEQSPQHGNDSLLRMFHTPRLWNKSRVFLGARLTSGRPWTARACRVAAGREAVVGARIEANGGANGQGSDARQTYCSYQPEAKM